MIEKGNKKMRFRTKKKINRMNNKIRISNKSNRNKFKIVQKYCIKIAILTK